MLYYYLKGPCLCLYTYSYELRGFYCQEGDRGVLARWFVIYDPGKPLMQQDGGVYSLCWVHRQPYKTQHPGLEAWRSLIIQVSREAKRHV